MVRPDKPDGTSRNTDRQTIAHGPVAIGSRLDPCTSNELAELRIAR